MGSNIIGGGAPYSTGMPPWTPNLQVIPAAQVGWSEPSCAGVSGQSESGAANQALVGIPSGGGWSVKVHCH